MRATAAALAVAVAIAIAHHNNVIKMLVPLEMREIESPRIAARVHVGPEVKAHRVLLLACVHMCAVCVNCNKHLANYPESNKMLGSRGSLIYDRHAN